MIRDTEVIEASSTENLRLGTEADRRARLAGTAADAAKRAVDLMAAVNAQNPDRLVMALDRLECGIAAIKECVADLDDAPPDADVAAYRAELRAAPPVAYAAGSVLECGERRSGAGRRGPFDYYWVKCVGERRRAWPFNKRRAADREAA